MRIPSGDLAPVRRGRRRGCALPVALALVLAAAVGAGAWFLTRDDAVPIEDALGEACPAAPTTAEPVEVPRPRSVRFTLLNGTDRKGLAARTGDALAARSFVVEKTGNTPSPLAGPSRVYYGPGALPAATLLAAQVEGAQLVRQPKATGKLELVLGSHFRGLNSPAEAAALVPVSGPATPAGCS